GAPPAAPDSPLRAKEKVAGKEGVAARGPKAAVAKGAEPHRRLERGARDRAHRLWRVLARDGGDRRALLQERLDRCADSPGQVAGSVRASDRSVRTSLRAAQLSGQAARRDDAR